MLDMDKKKIRSMQRMAIAMIRCGFWSILFLVTVTLRLLKPSLYLSEKIHEIAQKGFTE